MHTSIVHINIIKKWHMQCFSRRTVHIGDVRFFNVIITFLFLYGQGFACRNHIRVYKRIPGDSNRLLVCGTQAAVNPQCRTVNVSALVTLYLLHVLLISVPIIVALRNWKMVGF